MGRQKQTTPLQRTPSSLRNEADVSEKRINGDAVASQTNGSATKTAVEDTSDSPGIGQLLICVLGIYAALYGAFLRTRDDRELTYQKPLVGCSAGGNHYHELSRSRRIRC